MQSLFNRLNDPMLVVKFQRFFGVYPKTDDFDDSVYHEQCYKSYKYYDKNGLDQHISEHDDFDNFEDGHGIVDRERYELRSRKPKSKTAANAQKNHAEDSVRYEVRSRFFHYLFSIGAGLGNEMFYCLFFPYWFWNADGYVCRRLVLVWCFIMYIGQAMKDIIRLPRPASPPVIRMEKRYELEYGMPSTHAMIGLAFPFALIYFTSSRYEYNSDACAVIAVVWCICVCTSRLYLGMHSVADVLAGLAFTCLILPFIIPALDWIDSFQLKSEYSPLVLVLVTLALALIYPQVDEWSSCRGDTTLILGLPSWSTCRGDTTAALGVTCGVGVASWLNYQSNFIPHDHELVGPPPYHIKTPDLEWCGQALLRMLMGYSSLFLTRQILKPLIYHISCFLFKLDRKDYEKNRRLFIVELPYKYITYAAISINVVYLSPILFRCFNIERPTAWTEV